jgi:hypothetical protein
MQEIIEHIGEDAFKNRLKEAVKLLEKNGIIIISSPNPKKEEGIDFVWPEDHLKEYSLNEIKKIVSEHDLQCYNTIGWYGKAKYMKKKFSKRQEKEYDRLKIISSGFAAAILAIMYPELAECYVLFCKKKEFKNEIFFY